LSNDIGTPYNIITVIIIDLKLNIIYTKIGLPFHREGQAGVIRFGVWGETLY